MRAQTARERAGMDHLGHECTRDVRPSDAPRGMPLATARCMLFRRIKSHGLSHHSYFVADGSDAAVIDPRRDIDVYLALARRGGHRIQWILETHRNEDYVTGSTALAAATGAEIAHAGELDFGYGTPVAEGDRFDIGRLRIRVLQTPGHTPESVTYTLADTSASEAPMLAFTGDALFVGDTGRVDLLGADQAPQMAARLHESIFDKILPLGDHVILCPAHGSGSVCGGAIADRDLSTLGFERRHSPGLRAGGREDFVRAKLAEQHVRPPYFTRMEAWNRKGNAPIYERLPVPPPMSPGELAEHIQQGGVVVDTRTPPAFAGGHIPGSYNIWLGGLATYLGWIVPVGAPILLVLPGGVDIAGVTRTLLRIGYDEVKGYLRGGFESWQNQGREIERHGTIDTADLGSRLRRGEDLVIVDVREPGEWAQGTIEGAHRIFVGELERRLDELPRDRPVVSMCSAGNRGGIGASILVKHGFREVHTYLGGLTAWQAMR